VTIFFVKKLATQRIAHIAVEARFRHLTLRSELLSIVDEDIVIKPSRISFSRPLSTLWIFDKSTDVRDFQSQS